MDDVTQASDASRSDISITPVPPAEAKPAVRRPPLAAAPPAKRPPPAAKQALAARPPRAETAATSDAAEESDDDGAPASVGFRFSRWLQNSSAMLISTLVHMVALIALSFIVVEPQIVQEMHEVLAQVMEETIPPDEATVELERQLTDVTEPTRAVFSSSMEVGPVGASGPQGGVTAPTIDKTLTDQMVASNNVDIGDIFIDTPSSKKLIVEVPDGQVGDARAVVDSYEEALDRITQEILWMMEKNDVLVVWAFDQSESMKDDQKEIRDRFEHVYRQLGLVGQRDKEALQTAILSYGEGYIQHTRKPTSDLSEIQAAINEVPLDKSGKEMMCSAVLQGIATHRAYAQRTRRQMALILVTDESGEREDNDSQLERVIAEAKAARCKVYVLGREAVFGYPYAHIRWVQKPINRVHWLRIDRGPETAFVEQLQTDGFHRRYDAHSSGSGPYECARMGRETGGIFFMLPSVETNLVRGEKRKYELESMRPYLPDLRSRMEVAADRDKSKLQTALTKVIYDLNPYNPVAQKIIEMRVAFSKDYSTFVQQARHEQQKAIIYLDYLAKVEKEVAKLQDARRYEASPRWQANYDLLYAQLVAYQARMYEYGASLEEFIKKPKTAPSTKGKLVFVHWDITTRQKTLTGDVVQPYIDRATVMFKDVIAKHPGTPWAARAEHELKRGFGVDLVPDYDVPDPPPGTVLEPVPKL